MNAIFGQDAQDVPFGGIGFARGAKGQKQTPPIAHGDGFVLVRGVGWGHGVDLVLKQSL
jgi:hypothetical protein